MGKKVRAKRTDVVPAEVGKSMRRQRKSAEMSLETVGKEIGCGKGHLSDVENAKGNLSLPKFLEYCEAINAPVHIVLGEGFYEKDRDVVRLTDGLLKTIGVSDLRWLAKLDRAMARLALNRAREAVDYAVGSRKKAR